MSLTEEKAELHSHTSVSVGSCLRHGIEMWNNRVLVRCGPFSLRLRHEVCDTTEVKWLACLGCGDVALGGLILLCRLGVCVVSSSPCEAREFDVDVRVGPMLPRTLEVSGSGVALSSRVCCQFKCGEACVSCLRALSACFHSH